MKTHGKYPGIGADTYAERAIDMVIAEKSIEGPLLAARLGISVYEIGVLKRAVALRYLKKGKAGSGNTNVYEAGENLPALGQSKKSLAHLLLERIAANGALTCRALGDLVDMTPAAVSGCLNHHTKNGVLKVRQVAAVVVGKKRTISEYYDANLPLYFENCARASERGASPAPVDKVALNLVPPRTPPEFRPMKAARLGPPLYREGSLDYRDIPSTYARNECA